MVEKAISEYQDLESIFGTIIATFEFGEGNKRQTYYIRKLKPYPPDSYGNENRFRLSVLNERGEQEGFFEGDWIETLEGVNFKNELSYRGHYEHYMISNGFLLSKGKFIRANEGDPRYQKKVMPKAISELFHQKIVSSWNSSQNPSEKATQMYTLDLPKFGLRVIENDQVARQRTRTKFIVSLPF